MNQIAVADEEDLEALFERVSAERAVAMESEPSPLPIAATASAASANDGESIHERIGHLTRTLHDALRDLGYDRKIANAAQSLPDAQDRLTYIATLTGQAAERVLAAVEVSQKVQQDLERDAKAMATRWDRLVAGELSVDDFKSLAADTRDFLAGLPGRTSETGKQLTEIMIAQDFHDLSGQVIKRIAEIARKLEANLVGILVATSRVDAIEEGPLAGPNVKGAAATDCVHDQGQVDALLESLGF